MDAAPGVRRTIIGRRGAALLFFAMLDLVFAWGLFDRPEAPAPLYDWMAQIMPLWAWGVCWLIPGLACLIGAFMRRDTWAFAAAITIKAAWGVLSLLSWIDGVGQRGYVSAMIWLSFSAFVLLIAGGIPPPAPRTRKGRRWTRW